MRDKLLINACVSLVETRFCQLTGPEKHSGSTLALAMAHSPFKLNLHFAKKSKCCKIRKIYACEVCKFCTLLYYAYHKMAEIHFVVSVIQK